MFIKKKLHKKKKKTLTELRVFLRKLIILFFFPLHLHLLLYYKCASLSNHIFRSFNFSRSNIIMSLWSVQLVKLDLKMKYKLYFFFPWIYNREITFIFEILVSMAGSLLWSFFFALFFIFFNCVNIIIIGLAG